MVCFVHFDIFWLENVLRATTACTFSSSQLPKVEPKSGLRPSVFYIFDVEMCFPPQWRALFRHLNFQKCSENGVLSTFWLRHVLCATTACNFSSHLARWLCARRFGEPTFRPSGATNHCKIQWIATLLPFHAPASSILWLFLFSDLFSSSLFFSDSSHLCFSICPYCRKFDF